MRTHAERGVEVPSLSLSALVATGVEGGEVRTSLDQTQGVVLLPRDPPFLGRNAELEIVRVSLESMCAGQGGLILVGGEPGIGKTRLAERAAHDALFFDAKVIWGRCWDGHGAPSFWPWIQVLRGTGCTSVDEEPGLHFPEIGSVLQDLGVHVPQRASPESEQLRFWLFDVVANILSRTAAHGPVLIVLDDLQWADPPSLLLLQFLAAELNASRLLILGTYRDTALASDHPLKSLLPNVCRHRWTRRLLLQGLSKIEVGRFIRDATGATPTERVTGFFATRTGGNPFFLTEIVRLLGAEGCAVLEQNALTGRGLPETVCDAVDRRLSTLPARTFDVLCHAAIIGHEFHIDLLAAHIDRATDQVRDELEPAVKAKLVLTAGIGQYRFAHALVRDFIYGCIPLGDRQLQHARVAAVLERAHDVDRDVPVAAIADHYVMAGHAGDGPKAFQYSIAAAEQAIAAFAYEDAVTHYQRSLKCLAATSVPADRRCELLLCLADAQKRAGDWRQSREIFSQAAHLARQTNSAPSLARAAIGFSGLTARSPVDYEAVTLLREALANVDDPRVRVRLLGALVFTLHFDPDPTERIGLSAEALALSRGLDDASLLGEALEARINIMVGRCHADGLADLASEAIGLAARFENPSLAFRCRTLRYAALIQIGRAREAEIEFQCCARLAAELRYPKYLWQVAAIKATRSTAKGEFAIAEQLIEEAQAVGQRHDAQVVDQYRIIQYITLLYLRGDVGTAEAALRGLVAEYPHFALTHAVFASACAALGRLSETRDALAWFDWSELCAISGFMGPFTLCYIAEAAALSRDEARARVLYWLLTPYAQQYAAMGWGGGWLGSISHYLGLLAGAVGEFDTASRHFEDAVVMNRRMDAPPFVAVTQRRYAEMLLRRNRRGDRSCARDLLQKALTTFERLHMNGHREAAEALLLGCVSVSRRSEELSKRDANSVPGSALTKSDARSSLGSPECVFRREADYWTISFEGRVLRLRNTRGLQLLSLLLRCPDANHHVLDLISAIDRQPAEMCLPHSRGPGGGAEVVATRSDAGTVIDARAREEYRRRINDLCTELEEAERFNDLGRVEALLVEKDRVSKELERAYGRGGHRRTVASASERARINIRNNISNALKRFKRSDVVLWRHLSTAVRTGTFCSYRPERPVRWTF